MNDKIYSRKRLLIPGFSRRRNRGRGIGNIFTRKRGVFRRRSFGNSNENDCGDNWNGENNNLDKIMGKKTIKTAIVVIIAVFMAGRIISTIEPTMDVLCKDMAKSIATEISNKQATVVMR